MDLRNSNSFELRNFCYTTVWKLSSKLFIRSGKMLHVESGALLVEFNSGTSKSSK